MQFLTSTLNKIDSFNDRLGEYLSYFILFLFVIVVMEVVRRYFFNSPTVWGNELTQLTFGVYVVLAGPYVLRWGGHANVDLLYSRFSPKVKAIIDIITFPVFLIFAGMLFLYGGSFALESTLAFERSQSAWNPHLWPFKLCIPIAATLLIIQGLAKLARDIMIVVQGGNKDLKNEDIGEQS